MSSAHRTMLVVLLIGLVALVACGGPQQATSDATSTSPPTPGGQATTTTTEEELSGTTSTSPPDTTTSTAAPDVTTTTTSAPSTGSREEPLPLGEVVEVGDWRLRVTGVTADATDQVLDENQFNEPPTEGRQFFLVLLEGTYVGSESSDFWVDVSLKAVGPSNVAYEGFEDGCGVIPDPIDESGETFEGGSISGNACWSVTAEDAEGLVLLAEETLSFDDTRVYVSLDPSAAPVEASTGDGVEGSSRLADAVPMGEAAPVGAWTLTVVDVIPDATDAVLEENQFNEPPADGEQFYMTTVEGTYEGEETSTFWLDMSLSAVGDLSVAYEGFAGSCGVVPDPVDDSGETFPGGTVTGNVCWNVDSRDVGSLVMIAEESLTLDDTRAFFSLTP